jgi:hypothetical protein
MRRDSGLGSGFSEVGAKLRTQRLPTLGTREQEFRRRRGALRARQGAKKLQSRDHLTNLFIDGH